MGELHLSDLVVTGARSSSGKAAAIGEELAAHLGIPFVERRSDTVKALTHRQGVAAAIVVEAQRIRLVRNGRSYGFHPSMARHRIVALKAGGSDHFADAAQLQPGDSVLDCSFGLGADAIVASHIVGGRGLVLGLEVSPILAAMVRCGMSHYDHSDAELVSAMRRIDVRHADHTTLLPSLDTGSHDVVYFDPMFEKTFEAAGSLDLVRILASRKPPDIAIIAEARRVARRSVVVKDCAPGILLDALGIPVVMTSRRRVWYGRLPA